MLCLPLNVNPNSLLLILHNSRAHLIKKIKNKVLPSLHNYCSNEELTPSCFNKEGTQLWCLGLFVVNEEQGKQESLNQYRIIMDMHDIANQKVFQQWLHNIHKVDFLEKQCHAAMKNCSAPINLEHEQP